MCVERQFIQGIRIQRVRTTSTWRTPHPNDCYLAARGTLTAAGPPIVIVCLMGGVNT